MAEYQILIIIFSILFIVFFLFIIAVGTAIISMSHSLKDLSEIAYRKYKEENGKDSIFSKP